ncbi:hypothetical protein N5B55_05150 [Ralstonia pickettii]|uniref:hypothetical protein n=1 Tax=Ralstonia pickettii TaxID=329 RepID=UPI002714842B|nr:hypothetical protein [Ralstonia pickettii]WKZ86342.1 hypothetical protein N5B55_05150 [Ralstonia pickettii]
MGIEVSGVERLRMVLEQAGERAVRGVFKQMVTEAEGVRDLARKFAPVDEGNLEQAIKVQVEGGGRDERGRFARKSVAVYIDMATPAENGRTVGDYAWEMHEHLTPYGPLQLGKRSQAKQDGQSEMVGGKFLERAAVERTKDMVDRLILEARSYL